jgi:hypothetical protein
MRVPTAGKISIMIKVWRNISEYAFLTAMTLPAVEGLCTYNRMLFTVVHNWKLLVDGIHDHILTLNWNYIVALSKAKVHYLNEYATLEDNHTIKVT